MIWQKITMKTTSLVVTILVIVLGVYDAIAVAYGVITGQEIAVTVSSYLIHMGFHAPMVGIMIGFVCGHLFGYVRIICPKCGTPMIEASRGKNGANNAVGGEQLQVPKGD